MKKPREDEYVFVVAARALHEMDAAKKLLKQGTVRNIRTDDKSKRQYLN